MKENHKMNLERYVYQYFRAGLFLVLCLGMVSVFFVCRASAAESDSYAEGTEQTLTETEEELREDPEYYKYYNDDGTLKETPGFDDLISEEQTSEDVSENSGTGTGTTQNGQISTDATESSLAGTAITGGKVKTIFTGLKVNTGRTTFITKNGTIAHGIDVSKWQETINWKKVKAAGVDYAIIRCGYRTLNTGELCEDPTFITNIKGALAVGMKVGVYIFSQATTAKEARAEADACIEWLGSYLYQLQMPIVMDVEYGSSSNPGRLANAGLSSTKQTNVILAFADEVKKAGAVPAFYCNKYFTQYKLKANTLVNAGCALWLARVNKYAKTSSDTFIPDSYFMWQYDEGYCPGISTHETDLNFVYEDCLDFIDPDDENCTFDSGTSEETSDSTQSTTDSTVQLVSSTQSTKQVSGFTLSCGTKYIKLSWTAISDSYGYVIRRSTNGKTWTRVAVLKDAATTTWTDKAASASTVYRYQISPRLSVNGILRGNYTSSIYGIRKPAAPTVASTTASSDTAITLAWSKISKATGYRVYRKTAKTDYSLLGVVTTASYKDDTAQLGVTYTYRVRAYVDLPNGKRIYGSYTKEMVKTLRPKAPVMLSAEAVNPSTIHVIWKPASGALGYKIYRKKAGGSYSFLADVAAKSSNTLLEYTDKTAQLGVTYYYRVRYYIKKDSARIYSYYSQSVSGHTIPAVTKLKSLTSSGFNGLTLKWKAVAGAEGYYVQRVNSDGTRSKVANVSGSTHSYRITGLTKGKKYTYTVRAYVVRNKKKIFGEVNALGLSAKPTVPTTKFSLTSKKSGKVTLTWDKVLSASGYVIYYKASAKGKAKKVTTVKASKRAKNIKATAGKYGYYAVRAYRTVNGKKVYAKYSWKKIKVKS